LLFLANRPVLKNLLAQFAQLLNHPSLRLIGFVDFTFRFFHDGKDLIDPFTKMRV
jgi:hypothetical protein